MAIEVEQKFRVADLAKIIERLAEFQSSAPETTTQVDCYYSHPNRDFARSDEALRLRRVGVHNYITYKGPKLDATTKTRREIEIELSAGDATAAAAAELLEAIGFRRVAEVTKRRTHCTLRYADWEVGVSFDEVMELGHFVELEIMAEAASMPAARDSLAALAAKLGLSNCERRSYLELLLASRQ
jgi:adenylate cyclase class 2